MIKQTIRQAHDGPNIIWPEKFLPPEVAEEVRLVPLERTKRPLYVSQNGQGYSCRALKDVETGEPVGFMLSAIKDSQKTDHREKKLCQTGKEYRHFRHHGNIRVHHAVLQAWVGPCPEGYQCDHLNGNNVDNRLENLQWVTPRENQRRAKILKEFRKQFSSFEKAQEALAAMSREKLLRLFAQG